MLTVRILSTRHLSEYLIFSSRLLPQTLYIHFIAEDKVFA